MTQMCGRFDISVEFTDDGEVIITGIDGAGNALNDQQTKQVVQALNDEIAPYDYRVVIPHFQGKRMGTWMDVYDRDGRDIGDAESCYLYLACTYYKDRYKIGITNNPYRRAGELQATIIHTIECPLVKRTSYEKDLHSLLWRKGKHIEKEWFKLTDEDVEYIKSIKTIVELRNELGRIENEEHEKANRGAAILFKALTQVFTEGRPIELSDLLSEPSAPFPPPPLHKRPTPDTEQEQP